MVLLQGHYFSSIRLCEGFLQETQELVFVGSEILKASCLQLWLWFINHKSGDLMGKLGKSIQAGLCLWFSTGSYWLLPTTINLLCFLLTSIWELPGPTRHYHSAVCLERQCPPLSALFLFFLSFRVIQTLYLHRNSLTLWSKLDSPHRPSGPCHSFNCTSPSALSLLLRVWLSPPRACQFELEAVCAGICWSTIVILSLYFLWDGVGRRAQKLSKGWQGSVNSKDVAHISSYSVNLSIYACVGRVVLK